MSCGLKEVLEYFENAGLVLGCFWALEHVSKASGGPFSGPTRSRVLCVLNCKHSNYRLENVASNPPLPLTDHTMLEQKGLRDQLIQMQFLKEETGAQKR